MNPLGRPAARGENERAKASEFIHGVTVKTLKVWPDTAQGREVIRRPGFLMEVVREDDGLLRRFGQTTFTVAYPGAIKAFHWHRRQDDVWFVASGKALIVLYDRRWDSPTAGQVQTLTAGADDWKVLAIPAGVVHGYKVLGDQPVLLLYHTTQAYNPGAPDEERLPYDDPHIGFDWSQWS